MRCGVVFVGLACWTCLLLWFARVADSDNPDATRAAQTSTPTIRAFLPPPNTLPSHSSPATQTLQPAAVPGPSRNVHGVIRPRRLFAPAFCQQALDGGRRVGEIADMLEVFESPLPAACQAWREIEREKLNRSWPWAWAGIEKGIDTRQFCGKSGKAQKGNHWDVYYYNGTARFFHRLRNVASLKGKLYVAPAKLAALRSACEVAAPPTACSAVATSTTGFELRHNARHPFVGGAWPRPVYISTSVYSTAVLAGPEQRAVQDALRECRGSCIAFPVAVLLAPVDFAFSFHLIGDLALQVIHTVLDRLRNNVTTAWLLQRPMLAQRGFTPKSCHHGARVCIDKDQSDWMDFMKFAAGGRAAMVGLDGDDLAGNRVVAVGELRVGSPAHCETSIGRESSAIELRENLRGSAAALDCSVLYSEWRRTAARFLAERGQRSDVPEIVGASELTRPRIVLLSRSNASSRRLLDESVAAAALRRSLPHAEVSVRGASSLASAYRAFSEATVVIAAHGAGLVNAMFLRRNSGLVVLDFEAPPFAPFVPSYVHFEVVRSTCVETGPKNKGRRLSCNGDVFQFNDARLRTAGVRHLVATVSQMLRDQAASTVAPVERRCA